MTVLIVTHSEDNECVERVTEALARRGERAVRFDTDRYPGEVALSARLARGARSLSLESAGERVELDDLTAVWHRRLRTGTRIPETLEAQVRAASVEESRRVVNGLLASLTCFVLDPWARIRLAESKQLQLELARAAGLDVPRTLITNDPAAVRGFFEACGGRVMAKMMASFAIQEDGREKVVFTNPLSAADLEALDGLRLCPMTFQERLEKTVELRVTVVGRRVFTAAIESSSLERARTDWRREGLALLEHWKPHALPAEAELGLLAVMDTLGLNYGAADFVLTPDGRCVFLEVNPAGEFFWLERLGAFPVSEALADVLLARAPRRELPLLADDPRARLGTSRLGT